MNPEMLIPNVGRAPRGIVVGHTLFAGPCGAHSHPTVDLAGAILFILQFKHCLTRWHASVLAAKISLRGLKRMRRARTEQANYCQRYRS
jgi:hypothetical protein